MMDVIGVFYSWILSYKTARVQLDSSSFQILASVGNFFELWLHENRPSIVSMQ